MKLRTKICAGCDRLCADYLNSSGSIPRAIRAVTPNISAGAQVCDLCLREQHRPSEVKAFTVAPVKEEPLGSP